MDTILNFLKIDLSLALLLFIPGYLFLITLMRNKNPLGLLGNIVISMALSLTILNFGIIVLDKLGIKLNPANIIIFISTLDALLLILFGIFQKDIPQKTKKVANNKIFWLIFLAIVLLSIFIRIIYLSPKIIPHTTDLGHHMYWVNYIINFQQLPVYGIPDVIIGEHIIFGALSILTNIGIFTALPLMLLFIINLFSILAIFLLTKELASLVFKKTSSLLIALIALLSIGVFYATASPQASYINGGVVGNLMGGLLIPSVLYLFIKAFKEKNSTLAALGILLIGNLIYTHHLSAFILAYSLTGFLVIFLIGFLKIKFLLKKNELKIEPFLKTFLNLKTILASAFIGVLIFFVRVPSYLNLSTIDSAVGEPSKATRFGLTLNNIIDSTGPWRFFYSLVGIVFLSFLFWEIFKKNSKFKKVYKAQKSPLLNLLILFSLAFGWFGTIFMMSYKPELLKVDILTTRVVNYLTYPSAVLAAFGVYAVLKPVFEKKKAQLTKLILFSLVFIPAVISGLGDVSNNYSENKTDFDETIQTFKGAQYLTEKTSPEDKILRDHVYLMADTWIKNFLMRDYEEPISRTFSKKYNDPIRDRETCTRDMILEPDSPVGKECFKETQVKFIILKDNYDTSQFEASNNFSKIFSTDKAVIFQKNYE
jgi:hypothetical protein